MSTDPDTVLRRRPSIRRLAWGGFTGVVTLISSAIFAAGLWWVLTQCGAPPTCIPPVAALWLMAGLVGSGLAIAGSMRPLDQPLYDLPQGPVACAEPWDRGWLGLGLGAAMEAGLLLPGWLGAPMELMAVLAAVPLLYVAVTGALTQLRHHPTELRLDVHALEIWTVPPFGDALQRRLRIPLHEIRDIGIVQRQAAMEINHEMFVQRELAIRLPGGKTVRLPLPMREDAANVFVYQLRQMTSEAKRALPDAEAVEQLRRLTGRAEDEGGR